MPVAALAIAARLGLPLPLSSALACPRCDAPALVLEPERVICAQCAMSTPVGPDEAQEVGPRLVIAHGDEGEASTLALARLKAPGSESADRAVVIIERGRSYDQALRAVLLRVVERVLLDGPSDLEPASYELSAWLAQRRRVEGNHPRYDTERLEAARLAGVVPVTLAPIDPEVPVNRWLRAELASAGLGGDSADELLDIARSELPGPFALVDEAVAARHVALIAGVALGEHAALRAPRCREIPGTTDEALALRYDLQVIGDRDGERISGWIYGTALVRRVIARTDVGDLVAPVGGQRPDVYWEHRQYPRPAGGALLYSGLLAPLPSRAGRLLGEGHRVSVLVELEDGRVVRLAEDESLRRTAPGVRELLLRRSVPI
jgi:hypothetical protein